MPQRRAFHPALDFVVVRPFIHGEFAYAAEDPFPKEREFVDGHATGGFVRAGQATKDHIPERLLRQLWEQYRLDCVDPSEGGAEAPVVATATDAADTPVEGAGGASEADLAAIAGNMEPTPPAGDLQADLADPNAITEATELDAGSVGSLSEVLEGGATGAVSQTEVVFAKPYAAKHKGFGKYEVADAAGVVVADDLTKDAAAELVAANQ